METQGSWDVAVKQFWYNTKCWIYCWSDEVWTLRHTQLRLFNKPCYFLPSLRLLLLLFFGFARSPFWMTLVLGIFGYQTRRAVNKVLVLTALLTSCSVSDGIWHPGLDPNYYLAWRPKSNRAEHFSQYLLLCTTVCKKFMGLGRCEGEKINSEHWSSEMRQSPQEAGFIA